MVLNPITKVSRRVLSPAILRLAGTIIGVETQNPVAALTFDDGPHPEYTLGLLEVLEKHNARATFFMIGEAAQRYPELVRRVAEAGHTIGNHSWDHMSFPSISRSTRLRQIRACARALAPYGERIMRPPYGHQTMASRLDALLLRYKVITWNVTAEDWLDHDADWMANRLISGIRPGCVVLLHDSLCKPRVKRAADRRPMHDAVNMVLEQLGHQYTFITVPALLQQGRPVRRPWLVRNDDDR